MLATIFEEHFFYVFVSKLSTHQCKAWVNMEKFKKNVFINVICAAKCAVSILPFCQHFQILPSLLSVQEYPV